MPESQGNSRGRRSREEILDVASRVMADRGYAATSMSLLTQESGLPRSAINHHHFDSKAGLLSAVMARGAYEFFTEMRRMHEGGPGPGTPRERLDWFLVRTGWAFLNKPEFLRLHLILLMSAEANESEVRSILEQVRRDGRAYMHEMIATAFAGEGAEIAETVATALDYFAIAGFDGSFVALTAEPERSMDEQMHILSAAVASVGEEMALRLRAGRRTRNKR